MKCEYKLHVAAKCPKGGRDEYLVIVEADTMIPVETIISIIDVEVAKPVFQEAMTQLIAEQLDHLPVDSTDQPVVGVVRTIGYHSGVRTECVEDFG